MEIESEDFWKWVARQIARNSPRGDFIREVREAFRNGEDPNISIGFSGDEGLESLLTEWDKLHPPSRRWENNRIDRRLKSRKIIISVRPRLK